MQYADQAYGVEEGARMTSAAPLFVLQPTRGDRFGLSQASTEQRRVRARDGEDVLYIWVKGAPSRVVEKESNGYQSCKI